MQAIRQNAKLLQNVRCGQRTNGKR